VFAIDEIETIQQHYTNGTHQCMHGSVKYLFHGTPQKQHLSMHFSVGVLVFAMDEIETIQQHCTHGTE